MNNNQKDIEMDQNNHETSTNEEDESLLHIVNRLSHGTYSDAELAKLSGLRSAHVSQTETTSSLQEASQNLIGSVPSPSSDPYVHSEGQNQVDTASSTNNKSTSNDAAARMMLKDQLIVGEAAMYQKDHLVGAERAKAHQKDDAAARMMLKDQFIVGEAAMYQKDHLVGAERAKAHQKDDAAA
ncbi:hypothetical protein SEMRO_2697_G334990.1 [Seminavis robusta]|uniref:Uncharacterized protein n=1 Tax=Seminavis robusta TaxID=568900 RepID=A0A9N8HYY6_9STRA|nr:hypothetical protein SEMRO_2697_G334990.1 [Seminavis robusta]|eukprot:Sro2697_g334990.1 n/a (183) ;mRNA; f:10539-11087